MPEMVLKVLSLDGVPAWEAAVITTQGKFLPLLIANAS